MITTLHINTKGKRMALPVSEAEIAAISVQGQFHTTRGHLQRITHAASAHKMKRSEFIRHLLNTHPLMQEQAPC
jgi:hypothetical protein